jgi:hypothetical protein
MIFHVSIEAEEPRRVAEVIAELWGGTATPLDELVEGCWMAFNGDDPTRGIEVMPQGTNITEAGDTGWVGPRGGALRPTASHVALGPMLPREPVVASARREGWRPKYVRRADSFDVVEIWVNDHLVIEFLSPEMQAEYAAHVHRMVNANA